MAVEPEAEGEVPEVEVKFRRDLGLRDIVMIGLGPTIGTTIFTLMGPGRGIAGTGLLAVLVLNFVVTIFTAMVYVELASVVPETGGGYLWVKTAFSKPLGFLAGWLSWFGHSIVCAFYVVSFGVFIVFFAGPWLGSWPYQDWLVKGLSLSVLIVFLAVNYRGTRTTGKSSTLVTIVLVGMVAVYVAVGLIWLSFHPGAWANLQPIFPSGGFAPAIRVLMAMGLTFVVFEGYEIIAQTGEEVRDPEKNIPR
ncbi:MAG TPA: APC family permease, partial [Thermoplasmata archaeon]|nr:APC family permease [Thermoplasmata archaeon]